MNFLWFLGFVCLFAVLVQCQGDLSLAPKRGGMGKVCGSKLASLLSLVCGGNYNKKSVPYNEFQGEDYDDEQDDESDLPFLWHPSANALLMRNDVFSRRRRGVVDECCRKSCSWGQLRSYCARP